MKVCSRCILNSNIPGIKFDSNGECNYCKIHDKLENKYPLNEQGKKQLEKTIKKMKITSRNNKYDCLFGISGGCDSSYLLYKIKELGLNPLVFHFDNGWNTKIAEKNIDNLLENFNVDFIRIGVNQKEWNDINLSFLKASVSDADIPNDIALNSVHFWLANKFGIKYIIRGHSFRTEGTTPLGWSYMDGKYIRNVHNKFGKVKRSTFPNFTLSNQLYYYAIKRIKSIRLMYYFDYNKEGVKRFLEENFNWEWYGGHHLENKYTSFVTSYLLPKKFDIDKRIIEYSAHIRTGLMEREEALEKMKSPPHFDKKILKEVIKKLGLTKKEFESIMNKEIKSFQDYETYHPYFKKFKYLVWIACKFNLMPETFYVKYTKDPN